MDFDPNNNKQPKAIEWATYIPDRKPKFKTHKGRGQALNAFHYRNNAILYRYDFGKSEWIEVFRVEGKTKKEYCDLCKAYTVEESPYQAGKFYNRGEYMWSRIKPGGKVADPPRQVWVCRKCEEIQRSGQTAYDKRQVWIAENKRKQEERRIQRAIDNDLAL